ncbi:MAG: hypothetical protein ACJAZF_003135 [Granulosicoccus sp.]|jgi:hypothetical protein
MLCSVSASCFALVTYPDVQLMTTAALCRAVKLTNQILEQLKREKHLDKKFIG